MGKTWTLVLVWVSLLNALWAHLARQVGTQEIWRKSFPGNPSICYPLQPSPFQQFPLANLEYLRTSPVSVTIGGLSAGSWLPHGPKPLPFTPGTLMQSPWEGAVLSCGRGRVWFLDCPDTLFSVTPLTYNRLCRNFRLKEVLQVIRKNYSLDADHNPRNSTTQEIPLTGTNWSQLGSHSLRCLFPPTYR